MNYKEHAILVRSKHNGKFESRVECCRVVGAALEACLRLAYRPAVGAIPVPLQFLTPEHITAVALRDVLPPGYHAPVQTWTTQVFPEDAQLALTVLRDGLSKLVSPPYNLEVNTCDHTGASTCPTAHDVILSTRLGSQSSLPSGLYSLEIKCREINDKKAFQWEQTLTSEAEPLWKAELQQHSNCLWQGRVLLLVCLPVPCHAGGYSLHASILGRHPEAKWERLWGWSGFGDAMIPSTHCQRPVAPPIAIEPRMPQVSSVEQKWVKLKGKFKKDGRWVKVSTFLAGVEGFCAAQVKRFIVGPGKQQWKLGLHGGRALIEGRHWSRRSGKRGGGGGSGHQPFYVTEECLAEVFKKYYWDKTIKD